MKEFIEATNYNFGIKGNLTNSVLKAIAMSQKLGKETELKAYLKNLPPEQAFNIPSPGLDKLLGIVLTKENLNKQKVM